MGRNTSLLLVLAAAGVAALLVLFERSGGRSAGGVRATGPPAPAAEAADARATPAPRRVPVGTAATEPVGPAAGDTATSRADALAAIAALGAELGAALDLVRPDPDVAMLAALRALVLAGDLAAEDLRAATEGFASGDPRRVALVLASAWARDHGAATDGWLERLATDTAGTGAGVEQEALAAVLALDVAGRDAALESVARALLGSASGEAQGFAGLARVRAWFALEGLERFAGDANELHTWLEDLAGEHRVRSELWALGVRTDPALFGPAAIDGALAGDAQARAGIEALVGPEHVATLAALFDPGALDRVDPATARWVERSAARALVASADAEAAALLVAALGTADAVRRDAVLEALHTWREPAEPEVVYASQLRLLGALGDDGDARARVVADLQRRFERWAVERDAAAEERLALALERLERGGLEDGDALGLVRAWRAALE